MMKLSLMSHVTRAASVWRFFVSLIDSLGVATSISLRVNRTPGCTGLVRDSWVRDWLWLGKVLVPLTNPT